MSILYVILIVWVYALIGCAFAFRWTRAYVEKHSDTPMNEFSALRFVLRCCLLWPYLIFNEDAR